MRLFIEKVMGNAFSCCCCLKYKEEEETIDETSRLVSRKLNVTDSNGWQTTSCPPLGSFTDLLDSNESIGNNNKSQNKSIEKELSNRLIDITAIDRPLIDKHEWEERLRLYEKRVSQISQPLLLKSKVISTQTSEEPIEPPSERRFNPIDEKDLQLITYLSEKASQAVLNGFKIHSDDSVVVAFNTWTKTDS